MPSTVAPADKILNYLVVDNEGVVDVTEITTHGRTVLHIADDVATKKNIRADIIDISSDSEGEEDRLRTAPKKSRRSVAELATLLEILRGEDLKEIRYSLDRLQEDIITLVPESSYGIVDKELQTQTLSQFVQAIANKVLSVYGRILLPTPCRWPMLWTLYGSVRVISRFLRGQEMVHIRLSVCNLCLGIPSRSSLEDEEKWEPVVEYLAFLVTAAARTIQCRLAHELTRTSPRRSGESPITSPRMVAVTQIADRYEQTYGWVRDNKDNLFISMRPKLNLDKDSKFKLDPKFAAFPDLSGHRDATAPLLLVELAAAVTKSTDLRTSLVQQTATLNDLSRGATSARRALEKAEIRGTDLDTKVLDLQMKLNQSEQEVKRLSRIANECDELRVEAGRLREESQAMDVLQSAKLKRLMSADESAATAALNRLSEKQRDAQVENDRLRHERDAARANLNRAENERDAAVARVGREEARAETAEQLLAQERSDTTWTDVQFVASPAPSLEAELLRAQLEKAEEVASEAQNALEEESARTKAAHDELAAKRKQAQVASEEARAAVQELQAELDCAKERLEQAQADATTARDELATERKQEQVASEEARAAVQELQAELDCVKERLEQAQADATTARDELAAERKQAQVASEEARAAVQELQAELDCAKERLEQAQADATTARDELAAERKQEQVASEEARAAVQELQAELDCVKERLEQAQADATTARDELAAERKQEQVASEEARAAAQAELDRVICETELANSTDLKETQKSLDRVRESLAGDLNKRLDQARARDAAEHERFRERSKEELKQAQEEATLAQAELDRVRQETIAEVERVKTESREEMDRVRAENTRELDHKLNQAQRDLKAQAEAARAELLQQALDAIGGEILATDEEKKAHWDHQRLEKDKSEHVLLNENTEIARWLPRPASDRKSALRKWKSAETPQERKEVEQKHGFRPSGLDALAYADQIETSLVEPMHGQDLGLIQQYVRNWWKVDEDHDGGDGSAARMIRPKPLNLQTLRRDLDGLLQLFVRYRREHPNSFGSDGEWWKDLVQNKMEGSSADKYRVLWYFCDAHQLRTAGGQKRKWLYVRRIAKWMESQDEHILSNYTHPPITRPLESRDTVVAEGVLDLQQKFDASVDATARQLCQSLLQRVYTSHVKSGSHPYGLKATYVLLCLTLDVRDAQGQIFENNTSTTVQAMYAALLEHPSVRPALFFRIQHTQPVSRLSKARQSIAYLPPGKGAVLGRDVMNEIKLDTDKTILPSWVARVPNGWGTLSFGKLSAAQWHTLYLIHFPATLIALWHAHPSSRMQELLLHGLQLVELIQMASLREVTPQVVSRYETGYQAWLDKLLQLFPEESMTAIFHLGGHIPGNLASHGPAHSRGAQFYERFIYLIHQLTTNNRSGEVEITFLLSLARHAALMAFLEDDPAARSAASNALEALIKATEHDRPSVAQSLASLYGLGDPVAAVGAKPRLGLMRAADNRLIQAYCRKKQDPTAMDIDVQDLWEARVVDKIRIDYTTYCRAGIGATDRDCNILFESEGQGIRAGIIDTIIQRPGEGSAVWSTYLIVRVFATLKQADGAVDIFSQYATQTKLSKEITGWLCSASTDERKLVIEPEHVRGHFALLPYGTQYIPVSLQEIQSWLGSPAIYIWDCSGAGNLLSNFNSLAYKRDMEATQTHGGPPEGAQPSRPPRSFPPTVSRPASPPIDIALRYYIMNHQLPNNITADMVMHLPGDLKDRKTPLGELNWISTAVTDTIAWTMFSRDVITRLYRCDLLIASLFRNFLLAERIMKNYRCTPHTHPPLPPTNTHRLWATWNLAVDACLRQLPNLIAPVQDNNPNAATTLHPGRIGQAHAAKSGSMFGFLEAAPAPASKKGGGGGGGGSGSMSTFDSRMDHFKQEEIIFVLSCLVKEYRGFFVVCAWLYYGEDLRWKAGLDSDLDELELSITEQAVMDWLDEHDAAALPLVFLHHVHHLLDLSVDPYSEVAINAQTVLDYVLALLLESPFAKLPGTRVGSQAFFVPLAPSSPASVYGHEQGLGNGSRHPPPNLNLAKYASPYADLPPSRRSEFQVTPLTMMFHSFDKQLFIADERSDIMSVTRSRCFRPPDVLECPIAAFGTGPRRRRLCHFANGNPGKTRVTSLDVIDQDIGGIILTADGVVRLYRNYDLSINSAPVQLVSAFRGLTEIADIQGGSGVVMDWKQSAGLLLVGGDSRIVKVWDAQTETPMMDGKHTRKAR
ncbi:hypothetical protein MKEN_00329700 [Mycena kentingensis (nom. inval.)]|nr:hypothetical protein MKEN_00329700 [Mycena kentingensis (nom. inval.)]